jgi:glycosyltransferase involved in cell wall biosynthesis
MSNSGNARRPLSIACSLADQDFHQTKSVGIFNVSIGLAEQLSHAPEIERLVLLTNPTLGLKSLNLGKSSVIHEVTSPVSSKWGRILWDQWGVYSEARKQNVQWLFLPKGFASFIRPPGIKLVTYIHDAIHEFYRSKYPMKSGGSEAWYFSKSLRASIKYSNLICTNSEFSRREVLNLAQKHNLVCPPVNSIGIGFSAPAARSITKENAIVVLASRFLHKRTALAADYLARWQNTHAFDGRVYWVGSLPEGLLLPSFSNWALKPRLPDSEYKDLVRSARTLVYFSEYEGFGMPPLEATVAGTCAVYSCIPAMSESMGNVGFPFNNESYESFAKALDSSLGTQEESVLEWADTLLARHNWRLVTHKFLEGIRECDRTLGSS